jgi:thiol-disulfide isomerase/thioredoxin
MDPRDRFIHQVTAGRSFVDVGAMFAEDEWGTLSPFESGSIMPALSWRRLDGDGEIQVEALRGQAWLLEIWATWCRSCVAALPDLHRIHAASRNLTIVSLATDDDPAAIEKLRATKHPMPWLHACVDKREVVPGWSLPTIPVYVLVGADGVILAYSTKLDDPALIDGLKRFAKKSR